MTIPELSAPCSHVGLYYQSRNSTSENMTPDVQMCMVLSIYLTERTITHDPGSL